MKLFYIPITNKDSLKNFTNTIEKKITYNGDPIKNFLKKDLGVWGFKNGKYNEAQFEKISVGDWVFFRGKDENNDQCFIGYAQVFSTLQNRELAKKFWNDSRYENLILFNKYVKFEKTFKLTKSGRKLNTLPFNKIWHDGYNMFREWIIKDTNENVSPEDLMLYFKKIPYKVYYDSSSKEEYNLNLIHLDEELEILEKEVMSKRRVGQSKLRSRLLEEKKKCELCGVTKEELLIVSHIKPWKDSENNEKLDLNNSLLLCTLHDSLFDKGFISFNNDGKIMISDEIDAINRIYLNINSNMKIVLNEQKKKYLNYHRNIVFKNKK